MFQIIARFFQFFNPFALPTAEQVAKHYLDDSARKLIQHSADAVYHSKMVEYYQANVNRLSKGITTAPKGSTRAHKTSALPAAAKVTRRPRLAAA